MNEQARRVLVNLIAERGPELARDPERLASYLRDECGDCKAEIHVLMLAASEGIVEELLAIRDEPIDIATHRLAQRLARDRGTNPEAAEWAAASWANALGRTDLSRPARSNPRSPDPSLPHDSFRKPNGAERSVQQPPARPIRALVEHALKRLRTGEGKPRWMVIGAIVAGVALIGGQFVTSSSSRPRITNVQHPQTFAADGQAQTIRVSFEDRDGDVKQLLVEDLNRNWGGDETFAVENQAKGRTTGEVTFTVRSRTAGQKGALRLTLIDANQNRSESHEISFSAVAPAGPRIVGVRYLRQFPADGRKAFFTVHHDGGDIARVNADFQQGDWRNLVLKRTESDPKAPISFWLSHHQPQHGKFKLTAFDSKGVAGTPFEIEFDAVSSNAPAPPQGSTLRIGAVRFIGPSGQDAKRLEFALTVDNDDGGALQLEIVALRGAYDHFVISYAAQNDRKGPLSFWIAAGRPGPAVARVQLVDGQGHRSNAVEVPFEISSSSGSSTGTSPRR